MALGDPSTSEVWRSTGQELLASNREQEHLIEALLALASSEGGIDQRQPLDLATLTRQVLRIPVPDIDRLGLHVEADTRPAILDGNPLLVERMVANLVNNAVQHNVPDGRMKITTGTKQGCAALTVANTGPVIPPGEVDRLFQPFQRLNTRRVNEQVGGDHHGLAPSCSACHAVSPRSR